MASDLNELFTSTFFNFFNHLDEAGIDYVLLGQFNENIDSIDSDIDFMVSDKDFKKLDIVFNNINSIGSLRLVQVLRHEITAAYYVISIEGAQGFKLMALDACSDYRKNGVLWLKSEQVLKNRKKNKAGFWVPSDQDNFKYYLIKRIEKQSIAKQHLEYFEACISLNLDDYRTSLQELFGVVYAKKVEKAILSLDLKWFETELKTLAHKLRQNKPKQTMLTLFNSYLSEQKRKLSRIIEPTGIVITMLGPDGSGKSTILNFVVENFHEAFRKTKLFHLRPHFGKQSSGQSVENPHAQKPRSSFAGLSKLIYFLVDYWYGWIRYVLPNKFESTLIIFDRYYHDMSVDSYRYRLPNNFRFAKWSQVFVPKPDIWFIFIAPPPVLVERKGEVTLSEAEKQVEKYSSLKTELNNAFLIDTNSEMQKTLHQVQTQLLSELENRAKKKLKI